MTTEVTDISISLSLENRKKAALERCDKQIKWYEETKKDARDRYRFLQTIIVAMTGITPVVIVATDLKLVQAFFPAVATILTGVLGIYQYLDAWRRRVLALERLKSERFKYVTRTGDLYSTTFNDDQTLENFILKLEEIIFSEISDWEKSWSKMTKPTPKRNNQTKSS